MNFLYRRQQCQSRQKQQPQYIHPVDGGTLGFAHVRARVLDARNMPRKNDAGRIVRAPGVSHCLCGPHLHLMRTLSTASRQRQRPFFAGSDFGGGGAGLGCGCGLGCGGGVAGRSWCHWLNFCSCCCSCCGVRSCTGGVGLTSGCVGCGTGLVFSCGWRLPGCPVRFTGASDSGFQAARFPAARRFAAGIAAVAGPGYSHCSPH